MKAVLDYKLYAELARQAAAEGIVLLENKNKVLPLAKGAKLALFGRTQYDTVYCGTGSGGLVNVPYVVSIAEALSQSYALFPKLEETYRTWIEDNPFDKGEGWAMTPWSQVEMPVSEALIQEASAYTDVAAFVVGRTAGEDRDLIAEEGSYYLNQDELSLLKNLRQHFKQLIVILNTGNILDMQWMDQINPDAVLYVWQGGSVAGNAVADIMTARIAPSGKLPGTIARKIEDYPSNKQFGGADKIYYEEDIYVGYRYFETFAKEKVQYPFAYGLSFSRFQIKVENWEERDDKFVFSVRVKNTGDYRAKCAWQVYLEAPQGTLGQPSRKLVYFAKTSTLEPGEEELMQAEIRQEDCATFDDRGSSGYAHAFVLEQGEYLFHIGEDIRATENFASWQLDETKLIEVLDNALAPKETFNRMKPMRDEEGKFSLSWEELVVDSSQDSNNNPQQAVEAIGPNGELVLFQDWVEGKASLEEYLAQFSAEDLIALSRGIGMSPAGVTAGVAGAVGAVTEVLADTKMPLLAVADGPSGIRMDSGQMAFSIPNGTCLAASFNLDLNHQLFEMLALELRKNNISSLLGPGMNIHRHPLNGRNFEYFSEDPFLTGMMACAQTRGLATYNVAATVKHFACNNQEFKRTDYDVIVSERAVREIYLKGFELAVKRGGLTSIMTSYNKINGIWAASNYDLNTRILREQWAYTGVVMTDWWAKLNWDYGQEGKKEYLGAMIRAQNDLYMVTVNANHEHSTDYGLQELQENMISHSDLLRNASNICHFLRRHDLDLYPLDLSVENEPSIEGQDVEMVELGQMGDAFVIPLASYRPKQGSAVQYNFDVETLANYELSLQFSFATDVLAQANVSIYVNNVLMHLISLGDVKEVSETLHIACTKSHHNYVRFHFSEAGIKTYDIKVKRIDS